MVDTKVDTVSDALWQHHAPEALGMDSAKLAEAIAFARAHESLGARDLAGGLASVGPSNEPPEWREVTGPTRPRGAPNGLILRHGSLVAEWGDSEQVDLTFSATKSYLAVLAGVAVARGLIRSVDDPMRDYALDDGFDSDQNAAITWRHMLQQCSEWQGVLWGKPDQVDHYRQVGTGADNSKKGTVRPLPKATRPSQP